MLSIAASGMAVLPSFRIGVTSAGSHETGALENISLATQAARAQDWPRHLTLAASKMSLTAWDISGPMPSPSIRLTGYRPFGEISTVPWETALQGRMSDFRSRATVFTILLRERFPETKRHTLESFVPVNLATRSCCAEYCLRPWKRNR